MGPGMGCPGDSVPLRSTPAPPNVSCVPLRGTCIRRAPPPIFGRGWTTPRTPHTRTLSVRRHLRNLVDLQILVIIQSIIGVRGHHPGGVSTPGHGQGEGPASYKLFAQQMTQEMVGGAGAERVSAERSPPGWCSRTPRTHHYSMKQDDLESMDCPVILSFCPLGERYRTRRRRPIWRVVVSLMPFRRQRARTLVPFFRAILPRVSPERTV